MSDVLSSVLSSRVVKRSRRSLSSSSLYRITLSGRIRERSSEMLIPCTRYVNARRPYIINSASSYYAECVERGRENCDIRVSEVE